MKTSKKSAVSHFFSAALVLGIGLFGVCSAEEAESKLGYHAESVEPAEAEEGAFDTVIKKDGKEIARIPNARPVSFSPDGKILLLSEAAPDDSCELFLFNVAGGEKPKPFGKRKRIGGRYVQKATWSEDGKTITFTNNKELDENPTTTITVADSLSKVPAK